MLHRHYKTVRMFRIQYTKELVVSERNIQTYLIQMLMLSPLQCAGRQHKTNIKIAVRYRTNSIPQHHHRPNRHPFSTERITCSSSCAPSSALSDSRHYSTPPSSLGASTQRDRRGVRRTLLAEGAAAVTAVSISRTAPPSVPRLRRPVFYPYPWCSA